MRILITCIFLCNFTVSNAQRPFVVHFDFDKYSLTNATRATLDSFVSTTAEIPENSLHLSGHCDYVGPDPYNDELSRKRVAAVKSYLLKKGIPGSAFVKQDGFGERKPLNDNLTENKRQQNRRVEIYFIVPVKNLKQQISDKAVTVG